MLITVAAENTSSPPIALATMKEPGEDGAPARTRHIIERSDEICSRRRSKSVIRGNIKSFNVPFRNRY